MSSIFLDMEFTTNPEANMTITITASDITSRGNAVAFTAKGETITIGRIKGSYGVNAKNTPVWSVEVSGEFGPSLTDSRNRRFYTKSDAAAYATTLADAAKTAELIWW